MSYSSFVSYHQLQTQPSSAPLELHCAESIPWLIAIIVCKKPGIRIGHFGLYEYCGMLSTASSNGELRSYHFTVNTFSFVPITIFCAKYSSIMAINRIRIFFAKRIIPLPTGITSPIRSPANKIAS